MCVPVSKTLLVFAECVFITAALAKGRVELPALITDNMLLQARAIAPVWDVADPNEQVTMTIEDSKAAVRFGSDFTWNIRIGPLQPGGATTFFSIASPLESSGFTAPCFCEVLTSRNR
jgi:hypothetical protein